MSSASSMAEGCSWETRSINRQPQRLILIDKISLINCSVFTWLRTEIQLIILITECWMLEVEVREPHFFVDLQNKQTQRCQVTDGTVIRTISVIRRLGENLFLIVNSTRNVLNTRYIFSLEYQVFTNIGFVFKKFWFSTWYLGRNSVY